MLTYTKEETERKKRDVLRRIRKGAVFIHPTDTIYGIGCLASDDAAVRRVRDIKGQHEKPFSVIAPSKEWIYEHLQVNEKAEQWLEKLPGPYTLVLPIKKEAVAVSVTLGMDHLAVRMPDHWILQLVRELGEPIITPSANVKGAEPMTSLEEMEPSFGQHVELAMDDGPRKGKKSELVDLTEH